MEYLEDSGLVKQQPWIWPLTPLRMWGLWGRWAGNWLPLEEWGGVGRVGEGVTTHMAPCSVCSAPPGSQRGYPVPPPATVWPQPEEVSRGRQADSRPGLALHGLDSAESQAAVLMASSQQRVTQGEAWHGPGEGGGATVGELAEKGSILKRCREVVHRDVRLWLFSWIASVFPLYIQHISQLCPAMICCVDTADTLIR